MKKILNLTQHQATPAQIEVGVYNLGLYSLAQKRVNDLLTFNEMPTHSELMRNARVLTDIVRDENPDAVMIGGAPWFMSVLETALTYAGVQVYYAFSKRVSIESTDSDTGEVTKTNVFKHIGFIKGNDVGWVGGRRIL
jgi:hypothetical protein